MFILNAIIFIAGGIMLLFILSFFFPIDSGKSKVHGSAEFTRKSALTYGDNGWIVDGDRMALSRKNSYTHLLLVAPSGFGKSSTFCIPNLLQIDDCSIICTDPKGDLYQIASGVLKQKGFKVLLFDAELLNLSHHFNPLLRLEDDADIQHFANSLMEIENKGSKADAIWTRGAARIIQALISALKNHPNQEYCNLGTLIHHMKMLNTPKMHDFIERYGDIDTREWYEDWIKMPSRTRDGQVMTAQSILTRFDVKKIKLLTADDSFDFESLRKEKTAVFLKIPSGDPERVGPIISIFYAQIFRHLLSTSLTPNDLGIMVILEEFGNLSTIPNFASALTLLRSKKCALSLVVQDLQQIHSLYKSDANTIISNCSSILAYPGIKDPVSLTYLSKLLGRATVEVKTPGRATQLTGRDLLNPDEIRTLANSTAIFVHGNYYAEKITTLPVYQNEQLMNRCGLQSIAGELVPQTIVEQEPRALFEQYIRFPFESLEQEPETEPDRDLDQIFNDTL
jgi:type IV secretory pathway TraG/TraD family ATPase VirD4